MNRFPIASIQTALICGWLVTGGPAQAEKITTTDIETDITTALMPVINVVSENSWIAGTLLILLTFTLASLITWILFKVVSAITRRTGFELDDQIASLLKPPFYYTLVAVGIVAGLEVMPLPENIVMFCKRLLQSISVIVWMFFAIRLCPLLLDRVADLTHKFHLIQYRTVTLFDNLAKIAIFGAAIYLLFSIWNIDMTAWLASAGIIGIAIGFAAKDTLSNLFSGVFIIADAPFKVGDYVVSDHFGRGKVTHIGLRSTRILTRDDIEVTVPNSILGNTVIINQSGGQHEKLRIRLKIGVAYGSDVDKVVAVLLDAARTEQLVCTTPEPRVRFRNFGPSSLDFELLFWVENPELKGRAVHRMNTKVYKLLNSENIEIPYAKQDIYIKGLPERLADISSDNDQNRQ